MDAWSHVPPDKRRMSNEKPHFFISSLLLIQDINAVPMLDVDTVTGKLNGARGVEIDGKAYDVSFRDGSCISLFTGCDSATDDFQFTTLEAANAASVALLDQVLLDVPLLGQFDSQPDLVTGCDFKQFCYIATPFEVLEIQIDSSVFIRGSASLNSAAGYVIGDELNGLGTHSHLDLGQPGYEAVTWAIWSATNSIPEPTTLALTLSGVLSFVIVRKKAVAEREHAVVARG